MKTISHFMLPENTNTLYKNEARSSISLTKEVADKINEIVDALNEFSNDDLQWKQEQDGRVRGAVVYMKDNLQNSLNDLLEVLKGTGFIDARIKEHIETLIERVDNLLGSVTEGSTTLDAELIDVRVGANGETFLNAGDAVREQINQILNQIDTYSPLSVLNVGEVENGYINSLGELERSDVTLRTKNFLTLSGVESFLINANPKKYNIRIFRYSTNGVFEDEYENASTYRLDNGKKYKISFSLVHQRTLNVNDISMFPLLHYKAVNTIKPEMFGAVANDETVDNSHAFYSMFEYLKTVCPIAVFEGREVCDMKNVSFEFSGSYYVANGVYFPDMVNGVFNGLRLINTTFEGYVVTLAYARDCYFTNCLIDGNYKGSCIALSTSYSNCNIKDSSICHFSYYGIKTMGQGGHELNVVGCKIFQTEYQNFATMKNEVQNGCCIYIEPNDTDNLIADCIMCYACGERVIVINASSLMFNNNHVYNAGFGEIYIHETNGVYNGNYFDGITVHDARGGNFFTGNTFMSNNDFVCTLVKFTTDNYYGRKTYLSNNMFRYVNGTPFEGLNSDYVKLINNYDIGA